MLLKLVIVATMKMGIINTNNKVKYNYNNSDNDHN